eukprot:8935424-Pyramimonas_sp.AAC.1
MWLSVSICDGQAPLTREARLTSCVSGTPSSNSSSRMQRQLCGAGTHRQAHLLDKRNQTCTKDSSCARVECGDISFHELYSFAFQPWPYFIRLNWAPSAGFGEDCPSRTRNGRVVAR